ncbi:MAG: hypothetical protein AAGF11_37900, partial [Myxococcota bacterium]
MPMLLKNSLLTALALLPFTGCLAVEEDELTNSAEAQEQREALPEALADAFDEYIQCKSTGEECLSEEAEVIRYSEEIEIEEDIETEEDLSFRFGVFVTPCNDGSYVVCDCTNYATG